MARWQRDDISSDALFKQKRDTLIAVAAKAFGDRGYHATSLDDIAKTLNVTKAALYYYISGKQELLFECHGIRVGMLENALEKGHDVTGSGLERLTGFIDAYAASLEQEMGCCALLTEVAALTPENQQHLSARSLAATNDIEALVRDGLLDGSIRPDVDPPMITAMLLGAMNAMPRWYARFQRDPNAGSASERASGAPLGGGGTGSARDQMATLITKGLANHI